MSNFATFTDEEIATAAEHFPDHGPEGARETAIDYLMLSRMNADELREFCVFLSGYRSEAWLSARTEWLAIHQSKEAR